ncbi:MAG: hypothetical protein ACRDTD_28620 [Pseudonocardiaceae bacterium]
MPTTHGSTAIDSEDVNAAAERISGTTRRIALAPLDRGTFGDADVRLVYEFTQHTGTFKARGAANLATFHLAMKTMPRAGIVITSGGNAGLA